MRQENRTHDPVLITDFSIPNKHKTDFSVLQLLIQFINLFFSERMLKLSKLTKD